MAYPINITDSEGDYLDVFEGSLRTISYTHKKVHEGKIWDAQKTFSISSNGGEILFRIKATTKNLHIIFNVTAGADARFESYYGTTYTDDGIAVPIFNRIVNGITGETAEVYHTPTVNVLGTQRFDKFIPGGSGRQSSGGSDQSRIETIISAGQELLIKVVNLSSQTENAGITAEWYEEDEH